MILYFKENELATHLNDMVNKEIANIDHPGKIIFEK